LLASEQLVQTEAQLATSDPVLREVASHYAGITPDGLVGSITATTKINTQLFEIDVQNTNAQRAAQIANDVATTLIKQQMQATQQDNDHVRQQYQQEIDATSKSINTDNAKIAALQAQIVGAQAQGDQARVSSLQTQVNDVQGQVNRQRQYYNQWELILTQLNITNAQNSNFMRVAQPAQPPARPVRPQVLLNTAIGLAAGLLIGLLLVLLLEQLDTRIRTQEELTQMSGWSVLGTVWRVDPAKGEQDVILDSSKRNANMETYRILRTNIGFAAVDRPVHTILVTSALPGEGKSTIAANLAIVMAKAGKKVLLIDADLRRPSLHLKLRLPTNRPGLSEAMVEMQQVVNHNALVSGITDQHSAILSRCIYTGSIPNLRVMPSGILPPNTPELLESRAMDNLLHVLEKCDIDVVIFDTPPLLGLSDVSILMRKADAVLFVVDISRTRRKSVQQAKTLLSQAGSRVLGCVINKQRREHGDSSYYNYYYEKPHGDDRIQHPVTPHVPSVLVPSAEKNQISR
jgi:non-specific protein-tyrosine kinase